MADIIHQDEVTVTLVADIGVRALLTIWYWWACLLWDMEEKKEEKKKVNSGISHQIIISANNSKLVFKRKLFFSKRKIQNHQCFLEET